MFSKLEQWGFLTVFEKEDERRIAYIQLIVVSIFWIVCGILILLNVVWQDRYLTRILLLGAILQTIPMWLLIKGKSSVSNILFTGIYIGITTALASTGGGIHDYSIAAYPIIIMFSGLTNQRRDLWIATSLTLLAIAWLVLGENNGWLAYNYVFVPNWTDLIAVGALIIIAALAVNMLIANVNHGLAQTWRELAERKRAEESYTRLFNTVKEAIYIQSSDGVFLDVNEGVAKMYGYTREEMVGKKPEFLSAPGENDVEEISRLTRRVFNTGVSEEFEFWGKRKNGEVFPEECIANKGRYFGKDVLIVTARDVTERKRAEEALRESEVIFSSFLENSPVYVFFKDKNIRTLRLSRNYEKMLGVPVSEAIGRTMDELFPSPLAQKMVADDLQILKEGRRIDIVEELNGRYYETTKFPIFMDGEPEMLAGFTMDITDRKRNEAVLQIRLKILEFAPTHTLEELMQYALDEVGELTQSPVGFYHFVEPDEKTLSLQAWSTRTLQEFCKAEGKGMHYDVDQAGVWVDCVTQRKPVIHNDYASLPHRKGLPPGHAHVIRELVAPIFRDGSIVAIMGVGNKPTNYDETDVASVTHLADIVWEVVKRKLAEEKVNALNQELQSQVAELESFTYSVSHDLRSPLVTIKGFLGMLERDLNDNSPERIQHDMQRITKATEKMDALLSNLLELSRIGRIVNPYEEIDPMRMIEDAMESLDARIRSRNVNVIIARDIPTLFGDRIRLREVFENLIGNAAKYMGDQTDAVIEIGVRIESNEPVFYVKDNGMGIESNYHTKIFGLFEKLDPTIEGTGIGLALVKRIIETHGGKIWVESEGLGKGATFCFTIPDSRMK